MSHLDGMNEPLIRALRQLLARNILTDDDRRQANALLAQADKGFGPASSDPATVTWAVQRSDSQYAQAQAILTRYRR
ncbi:MAG: hypothetical protein WCE30_24065 [Mycobacterium sp.]